MTCQECSILNPTSFLECGNEPASRYRRSFGLMLLSRKELINPMTSPYLPQSNIRGYLSASVSLHYAIIHVTIIILLYN